MKHSWNNLASSVSYLRGWFVEIVEPYMFGCFAEIVEPYMCGCLVDICRYVERIEPWIRSAQYVSGRNVYIHISSEAFLALNMCDTSQLSV